MKLAKLFIALIILSLISPLYISQALTKKENVSFVRVIDGDTVVVKKGGKDITLRLLLIDTPESKAKDKPVQPYALEATRVMESYMKNAKLQIQYDTGGTTDKYGRHLVYLYSNNRLVNNEMVKYGYARVGYIYKQRYFLNTLKQSEQGAKNKKLKIWSLKGYVNPKGEGFIYNPKPAPTPAKKPAPAKNKTTSKGGYPTSKYKSGAPKTFQNCTAVKKYYPYGITYHHISFQKKFDADKDNLGCEATGIKYEPWMKNN